MCPVLGSDVRPCTVEVQQPFPSMLVSTMERVVSLAMPGFLSCLDGWKRDAVAGCTG